MNPQDLLLAMQSGQAMQEQHAQRRGLCKSRLLSRKLSLAALLQWLARPILLVALDL